MFSFRNYINFYSKTIYHYKKFIIRAILSFIPFILYFYTC